jgi:2-alkyl-3-oxoalkanoate reductase
MSDTWVDQAGGDSPAVLVVGAAGFVGRRLVERLHARGIRAIAGVRKARPAFAQRGIEQRVFDATDPAAARTAMAGVSHLVNCVMGPAPVMIASTKALLEAAGAGGVVRNVEFSSIAVFGNAEGAIGDDHPQGRNVDAYGQAKMDCEALVRMAQRQGLETLILRPALIYGPGSVPWTARIARLLQARRLGDLGAMGDGLCNLIHIEDVVEAAIAGLFAGDAAGKAFNLASADAPSWNRYLLDFARALGATPVHRLTARQLKLETKGLAIPLKIAEIVTGKLGFGRAWVPDPITPGLSRLFALQARYHSSAAAEILGPPRIPYAEGIAQSAAWVLQQQESR